MFQHGTLWQKTCDSTKKALQAGTLRPISTKGTVIYDGGVDFLVRVVSSLARKSEGKKETNPFLPYEESMFVAEISDTHICLLNKFNVIDHHLLIIPRSFEEQESLLTLQDFEAIRICMAEFDGLAFYNGGEIAGASQGHKHLQMIPLPMANKGPRIPIEPLFASARFKDDLGIVPGLPFVHTFARLAPTIQEAPQQGAKELLRLYRVMLYAAGLNAPSEPQDSRQSGPYNLLITREWMMLIPRSEECFDSISVNALGFAGALLVQNKQQVQRLKDEGCMSALRKTSFQSDDNLSMQEAQDKIG